MTRDIAPSILPTNAQAEEDVKPVLKQARTGKTAPVQCCGCQCKNATLDQSQRVRQKTLGEERGGSIEVVNEGPKASPEVIDLTHLE